MTYTVNNTIKAEIYVAFVGIRKLQGNLRMVANLFMNEQLDSDYNVPEISRVTVIPSGGVSSLRALEVGLLLLCLGPTWN